MARCHYTLTKDYFAHTGHSQNEHAQSQKLHVSMHVLVYLTRIKIPRDAELVALLSFES